MLGSFDIKNGIYLKMLIVVLSIMLLSFILPQNNADAASRISRSSTGQSLSYFYVGYGWGSISYDIYIDEDSTYTYRQELTYHQVIANYYASCVYQCKMNHSAGYKDSAGTLKSFSSIGSYGSTAKYAYYLKGGSWKSYSGGNYSGIYSRPSYRITLSVSPQLWVYRNSSWLLGDTNTHTYKL